MPTTSNFGWTTPADTDLVKDGASAIRTLGNGIDSSLVDLKGGTTGQVLAKASNTDLDFTWATDASGIPATIFDAKGDLIAASAADTAARLAVGANNTVLTADSSTSTGLKWAAVNAGSMTLLSTTSIAAAQTTTVSISATGYEGIRIVIRDFSLSSSGNQIYVRFNSDSNNNYFRTNTKSGFGQSDEVAGGGGATSYISTTSQVRNTQTDSIWILDVMNSEDTSVFKVGHFTSYYQRINDLGDGCESGGFTYKSTSAITSLTFGINSSGTFSGGDIKVYGVK